MEFITLNEDNLEREHICCAVSDKKGDACADSKKAWLRERFADGLVFRRLNVRGKVMIEYLPAEHAWCPIKADNYLHINCFWVAGQFKGQGYGSRLLESCMEDARAQGKAGVTVLSSSKKKPYLSDPAYLKKKGFLVADHAAPFFELLYLPLLPGAPVPKFRDCTKEGRTSEPGLVLYYTAQCPYTAKYVPLMADIVAQHGRSLTLHRLESAGQAQNAPSPFTTYSLFHDGAFVTNQILSDKQVEAFLQKLEENV